MIQIGDRVRCLETIPDTPLVANAVLTIREITYDIWYFTEIEGGWYEHRFVPVVTTFIISDV